MGQGVFGTHEKPVQVGLFVANLNTLNPKLQELQKAEPQKTSKALQKPHRTHIELFKKPFLNPLNPQAQLFSPKHNSLECGFLVGFVSSALGVSSFMSSVSGLDRFQSAYTMFSGLGL